MRDLAQLASRLFLPVGMRVGKCLNRENEGDESQGDGQHSHQVSPVCESAPHSHYGTHPNGSFGRPKVSSVSHTRSRSSACTVSICPQSIVSPGEGEANTCCESGAKGTTPLGAPTVRGPPLPRWPALENLRSFRRFTESGTSPFSATPFPGTASVVMLTPKLGHLLPWLEIQDGHHDVQLPAHRRRISVQKFGYLTNR